MSSCLTRQARKSKPIWRWLAAAIRPGRSCIRPRRAWSALDEFDALLPLNDLVEQYREEYNLDDIPQPVWDAATIGGNIYGVPFMSNTMHLFYRSDLFEKHMIAVPTTYDEVIDACAVLAENEDSIDLPFTMNLHAGWAWEIEFMHFIRSFGGKFLNDEDNTPAFNSDAGVAA